MDQSVIRLFPSTILSPRIAPEADCHAGDPYPEETIREIKDGEVYKIKLDHIYDLAPPNSVDKIAECAAEYESKAVRGECFSAMELAQIEDDPYKSSRGHDDKKLPLALQYAECGAPVANGNQSEHSGNKRYPLSDQHIRRDEPFGQMIDQDNADRNQIVANHPTDSPFVKVD